MSAGQQQTRHDFDNLIDALAELIDPARAEDRRLPHPVSEALSKATSAISALRDEVADELDERAAEAHR